MIGKLIRLIFLDKRGRDTWSRIEKAKEIKETGGRPKRGKKGAKPAVAKDSKTAAAKAPAGDSGRQLPRKVDPQKVEQLMQVEMTLQDQLAVVREAIDSAHQEMGLGPREPQQAPAPRPRASAAVSPAKKELIQAAMTIYRTKKNVLDNLSPEERAKLKAMAEVMLGGGK